MAIEYFNDVYKATEGQTTFKTSQVFTPGELIVTLNGVTMNLGEANDYIELDNLHIQFNTGLYEGDTVGIRNSGKTDTLNIDVVGYTGALFPLYGQSQHLMFNHFYGIKIKLKNKLIEWGFSSRYSPLYTTVKKVRTTAGDILGVIDDEKIAFLIYQNSKELDILMKRIKIEKDANDFDPPPMRVKAINEADDIMKHYKINWVLYKTCMDLLTAVYLTMSGQVGSVSKTIGPVVVSKTYKIPFIEDMMGNFKRSFDRYDGYLLGQRVTEHFVKAGHSDYPYGGRSLMNGKPRPPYNNRRRF